MGKEKDPQKASHQKGFAIGVDKIPMQVEYGELLGAIKTIKMNELDDLIVLAYKTLIIAINTISLVGKLCSAWFTM